MCKCARVENVNRMAVAQKRKSSHSHIGWFGKYTYSLHEFRWSNQKSQHDFLVHAEKCTHKLEYNMKNGRENSVSIKPNKTLKSYLSHVRPWRMRRCIVLEVTNIQEDRWFPIPIGLSKCKCSSDTNQKLPSLNYAIEKFLFHKTNFALMHKIYENYIW